MTFLREEKPQTLTQYLSLIDILQQESNDHPLWYRGCNHAEYELIPSIFRHKIIRDGDKILGVEKQIIARFRQRSIPFISHPLGDELDILFFMQHHEIPTRLLDWSENPLIGLYFAVMDNPTDSDIVVSSDAAVWVLNPIKWNKKVFSHLSYPGDVLSPGDDNLKTYKPTSDPIAMNKEPVAIYGNYNSSRIVAQQGVFTLFGKDNKSMNKLYEAEGFEKDTLVKIVLEKTYVQKIREALHRQGTIETVVFPELRGIALEIKRIFGFI